MCVCVCVCVCVCACVCVCVCVCVCLCVIHSTLGNGDANVIVKNCWDQHIALAVTFNQW